MQCHYFKSPVNLTRQFFVKSFLNCAYWCKISKIPYCIKSDTKQLWILEKKKKKRYTVVCSNIAIQIQIHSCFLFQTLVCVQQDVCLVQVNQHHDHLWNMSVYKFLLIRENILYWSYSATWIPNVDGTVLFCIQWDRYVIILQQNHKP